jgi:hypothetical protein
MSECVEYKTPYELHLEAQLTTANLALEECLGEREERKEDYERACGLVASMHQAAVGEICGPRRGVIEDIADLKAERDALLAENRALLDWVALPWVHIWDAPPLPDTPTTIAEVERVQGLEADLETAQRREKENWDAAGEWQFKAQSLAVENAGLRAALGQLELEQSRVVVTSDRRGYYQDRECDRCNAHPDWNGGREGPHYGGCLFTVLDRGRKTCLGCSHNDHQPIRYYSEPCMSCWVSGVPTKHSAALAALAPKVGEGE